MATGFMQRFKGKVTAAQIWLSGFFYESSANAVTAYAGGGQTNATLLTAEINRVATVATAGDSVKLPVTTNPGLTIVVVNAASKPMQVYGSGTDTINGVATATGVSQMPNSVVLYVTTASGAWVTEGLGTGYAGSFQTVSATDAIAAVNPGAQGTAILLTTTINRVTTVPAAASGVILPASAPGLEVTIVNAHASNSITVFAQGSDTIDGTAGSTGYVQAATKTATYFCTVAGAWHKQLSA